MANFSLLPDFTVVIFPADTTPGDGDEDDVSDIIELSENETLDKHLCGQPDIKVANLSLAQVLKL